MPLPKCPAALSWRSFSPNPLLLAKMIGVSNLQRLDSVQVLSAWKAKVMNFSLSVVLAQTVGVMWRRRFAKRFRRNGHECPAPKSTIIWQARQSDRENLGPRQMSVRHPKRCTFHTFLFHDGHSIDPLRPVGPIGLPSSFMMATNTGELSSGGLIL